jgi:cytochrome c553
LIAVIIGCGVAAVLAKSYFTADSFYRYGHYRGDSVAEIAAMTPSFQTPKPCTSCHAPRLAEWSAGLHKTVICEVCHNAAPGHPQALKVGLPSDTVRLCTQCHEAMPGRPLTSVRQVDSSTHYPSPQCISCHNPHSPKIAPSPKPASADLKEASANAAVCAACHGANGMAANDVWPNLAGQNPAYLARALGAFKTGTRKEPTMAPMAQTVPDDGVAKLAAYFGALACRAAPGRRGDGDAALGAKLAKQCAACHGGAGGPVNAAWPRLAGQNPGYLSTALKAFKDGSRDNPFMSPVARGLSDADISNLATHYASLGCSGAPH